MAKKEEGAVTVQSQGAIALPDDLRAELAGEAKDAAAEERPSLSKLSTAGGQLKYQGNVVAGNNMDVVVLAAIYRNVLYKGRYNPNDIKNPDCFALSDNDDEMAPHENVKEPMNASCDGCSAGQWGSNPEGGKGKWCKQSRRLVLIPAGACESAETVKKAEFALLDLPVTSVKNYPNFVNAVAASINLPPWAVVANIRVVPDPKTQFKVELTPIRQAGDADVLRALKGRREDAVRMGLMPYDETSETNSAVSAEQKERQAKADKKLG
jgi:hypothetical protein